MTLIINFDNEKSICLWPVNPNGNAYNGCILFYLSASEIDKYFIHDLPVIAIYDSLNYFWQLLLDSKFQSSIYFVVTCCQNESIAIF